MRIYTIIEVKETEIWRCSDVTSSVRGPWLCCWGKFFEGHGVDEVEFKLRIKDDSERGRGVAQTNRNLFRALVQVSAGRLRLSRYQIEGLLEHQSGGF